MKKAIAYAGAFMTVIASIVFCKIMDIFGEDSPWYTPAQEDEDTDSQTRWTVIKTVCKAEAESRLRK